MSAIVRSSKRRSLRVESLERREMMATDVSAIRHNSLVPTDVNGDFDISPVDALQVINALNRQSRGTLSANSSMYDVNNDGALSPVDALMVVNRLKTGEGVGELAGVDFQILDATNTPIVSTVGSDSVREFSVAPGTVFSIRTRARDLRSSPTGVFSTYVDINYATQGSALTELALVQWSEVQSLAFAKGTNGGTFTLTYGSETTAPITFGTSRTANQNAIASAVGALSVAGGAANVRVTSLAENATDGAVYDIAFVGNKARLDVTNPTIGSNNLTALGVAAAAPTISTIADPANKLSLSAAISFPVNPIGNGVSLFYNGGTSEATFQTIGTTGLRINDAGNFANATQAPQLDDASVLLSIFDTAFRASITTGKVDFSIGPSQNSRLGVGLFENDMILADTAVTFPSPFRIVIATDLTANPDTASVAQNSGATNIIVGANDTFLAGTNFTVTSVGTNVNGTIANVGGTNAAATVSFTPTTGFFGQTSFTYTITNDQTPAKTSTATVTVNVNAPNNAPVALTTALSATEAGPVVSFTPVQLFSPGNGEASQTVTLSSVALVAGQPGTISLVAGNVSYMPSADDFFGPVTFTVTGTDNGTPVAATTATFTINVADVNDAPFAKTATPTTPEDTNLTILASDLFSPGPGPESVSQTVSLASATPVAGQTGGTISVVGGNAQFVPTSQFSGMFAFVAIGQDSASPPLSSPPTTFTITVTPVNDAPTAVADTGASGFTVVRTAGVASPLNVLLNDLSGDVGDTITVTSVTQPASGTVAIGPNGTNVTYTPLATTPVGSVQKFTYTITDGGGLTSTANVEVFIDPPTRPFAVDDTTTTPEATLIVIDVLSNDFSNTGATKRLQTIGTIPSNVGTLALVDNGTPSDKSDDRIRFTPAAGFTSTATFTYTMDDTSNGSLVSTGTVTVNVGDFNDPPTVVNRTESTPEDTQLTILSSRILEGSTKGGVGEESQILTVTAASVTTPSAGSAVVTGGNVVYTPTPNFNGQVLISFTVTDNGQTNGVNDFKTASGTITVNVTAVNDAPVATATSGFAIAEDSATPLSIPASSLFSPGPANEASQLVSVKSAVAVAGQTGGSIAVVGGNAVFTPTLNFNGTFSFIVIGQDNGSPIAESLPSTVTINVTPVNDAPVPVVAVRAANATIPLTIDLTSELAQASRGGGADEAGQTVRVSRVIPVTGTNATKGTVTVNPDGTILYTAPFGSSGVDVFDYEVIDNGTTNGVADTKVGTARITINIAAFQPSSISGQVWIDDDRDGSKDSDELVMGGVTVILTGRSTGATTDIAPVQLTTSANGLYSFDGLAPGTYTVSFTPPIRMVDSPAANSETRTIVAPGGVNSVINFSVYGLEAGYNSIIENAESEFYLRNGQQWRDLGISALVKADGTSAWTINRGGFEAYRSESVRISSAGVTLTVVTASNQVLEATVPRGMFISTRDAAGNTLIRIFATPANLSFRSVAAGEGESSVASIDRVFAQMGR